MIFIKHSRRISDRFFLSLFERNPKEIADPAGRKKGEKQAVEGWMWKRAGWGVGGGETTIGLGLRPGVHRGCGTWNSGAGEGNLACPVEGIEVRGSRFELE